MYRRQYDDNPGMEMLQGVQAFGNAMRTGQQLEQGRMALEDEKGVNAAYEHIANKVGSTGDISALDGDPLMNTRYGTMAAGKFLGQRAQNETSRLQMLKAMSASDDEFYSKTFRPLAFAADEAYKSGDIQRFGAISSELSAKAPLPYKTEMDTDGNFKLLFRSDKDGGWSDTGRKLSPQEVMNEIGGIIGGEQKILAGADMQQKVVNPRFLAAAARYRMGTITGNADAMADPSKWIPMQKEGHTVWAVPQNRHDDYSAGPAYRIVDDSGKMGGMVGSLDELAQGGYVRADAKAKLAVLQKRANGGAAGAQAPGGKFSLSESDKSFIDKWSTYTNEDGEKQYDSEKALTLETLMSGFGLNRPAAVTAYARNVEAAASAIARANPHADPREVQKMAEKAVQYKIMSQQTHSLQAQANRRNALQPVVAQGIGGTSQGAAPQSPVQMAPTHRQDRLHENLRRAAVTPQR